MSKTLPPPPNETPAPVSLARNPCADLDAIARLLRQAIGGIEADHPLLAMGPLKTALSLAERWTRQ
jgi:hypothetical protein